MTWELGRVWAVRGPKEQRSAPPASGGGRGSCPRTRIAAVVPLGYARWADPALEYAMAATFVPVRLPPECLVEAAALMGRAAVDDPIFVYALPDAAQRAAGVPRMLETVLRIGLAHGEV